MSAACLTRTLSIRTPKSGPAIIDGAKFANATNPTKAADDVRSQAIQPIVTRCIQSALEANRFPPRYMRKSLNVSADIFILNRYSNVFSITMRYGSLKLNHLRRVGLIYNVFRRENILYLDSLKSVYYYRFGGSAVSWFCHLKPLETGSTTL